MTESIALTGIRVEHQIIMPNHVHLLLALERAATRAAPTGAGTQAATKIAPADDQTRVAARIVPIGAGTQADTRVASTDGGPRATAELGRLVGGMKSRSVHLAAGRGLEAGRLWQWGYYDHTVRSENDFLHI